MARCEYLTAYQEIIPLKANQGFSVRLDSEQLSRFN